MRKSVTLGRKWEDSVLFSMGIVSSGTYLHTAGITARDENGEVIAPGDMREQVSAVFEIIGGIIKGSGARWEDVVKYTIFTTDLRAYIELPLDVRSPYFPSKPAATAVEVRSLVHPDMVVEIEAIVCIPQHRA